VRFGATFAPDGTLWVKRANSVGRIPKYDRFNRDGAALGGVELEVGTTLLGFGARRLYVSRRDEDDLQFIQVFTLPAFENSTIRK
jgi:hypothetical protein